MKKIVVLFFVFLSLFSFTQHKVVFASEDERIFLLGNGKIEQVLEHKNMFKKFHIASLTKLMTAYVCYNQVKNSKISFEDNVNVSKNASEVEPSKAYLIDNMQYKLDDLFRVMLIKSANDCAIAIAEYISDTEQNFSELMNRTAKELGMKGTHYTNASGLSTLNQFSTAYDQYLLFLNILKIDYIVDILKTKEIAFNNGQTTNILQTTNKLIEKNIIGKTGFTLESKNCFCGTNLEGDNKFVYITLNEKTSEDRFDNVYSALLQANKNYYANCLIEEKDYIKKIPLSDCDLIYKPETDFCVLQSKSNKSNYSTIIKINKNLSFPIKKGEIVGDIIVINNNKIINRVHLISQNNIKRISLFSNIKRIFFKNIA